MTSPNNVQIVCMFRFQFEIGEANASRPRITQSWRDEVDRELLTKDRVGVEVVQ